MTSQQESIEAPVPGPGRIFYDDVAPGMSWTSARRTISEADISSFAGLSGDFNPLHTDAVFAAESGLGERVAHGMLVLSIATGLRQQLGLFNGTTRALLEVRSWTFRRPVFIGDTVSCRTTIASTSPTSGGDQGVVVQRVEVINQRDELVQEGELVSLVRARATGGAS